MLTDMLPSPSYLEAHSAGELRVARNTDPKKLANAIMKTAQDVRHAGRLTIRAAGSECVNIAAKSIIIANGSAARLGKAFYLHLSFDVVKGEDAADITIVVYTLRMVSQSALAAIYE